ncbi:MAG: hypothetical protein R8P61_08605 [Bacteroidia bacterium]|nr:hypothetical protein [Bacteroidia bacterium]
MEKSELRIQDYLSFGYLYLLILGIVRDSIYYGFMGINIIRYSDVMDVLLSPIAYLSQEYVLFLIFLFITYWVAIQPSFHKKHRSKKWYSRIFNVEKRDNIYAEAPLIPREMPLIALMVASLLLGTGVGKGIKTADKMKAAELKMLDEISFLDNETEKVHVIGQNSSFIFYVREGKKEVSVSPINGTIKRINMKE